MDSQASHDHSPASMLLPPPAGSIPDQRPILLTVPEVAEELRIARSYAYRLVHENSIPSVRIGRSVRVPRAALERWVDERTS